MPNKFNPFRPDKMAPPGLFAGRIDEIRAIDHCLLQTREGNPQHFLVEGERGIGKSSLFWLEQIVASGQLETMATKERLHFLAVSISLQEQDDYFSILRKIISELRAELLRRNAMKAFVLSAWEFVSKFEAAGIRYNRGATKVEEAELLSHLLTDFVKVLGDLPLGVQGILLLIDEADKPSPTAGLGLICKLLTEETSRRNCERLCIGLAGLPGIIQRLKAGHESSPRIFRTMNLKPLEKSECESVITQGLNQAHEKIGFTVGITREAMDAITSLSEGYPHFLQEFAYAAYEEDSDNVIDRSDVLACLFKENGPFQQLGRKFFAQFYAAPSSDDYRTVLHVMADGLDGWIDRGSIIQRSGLREGTVDNALRALKAKDIILQDDSKRGMYRLPTRAFAVWIKAQRQAKDAIDEALDPGFFSD